jgi:2-polyprenyl-3-methyl-5-hydroxy-6-metoxy-1,4-benzoquinol methylase
LIDLMQNSNKFRLLVVISSYGEKNIGFLRQIIEIYRRMAMEVDLFVVSNVPKNFGADVKVVVGLPDPNPWMLPFAHKTIFAQNVDRYDFFIYSEDDIEVTEENIRSFIDATAVMEPDEILGYIRYEICPDGTKLLTDVHGAFHWKPNSVRHRGKYTIAEFSNEHAGFYILTQFQLRRSIASGGFLIGPHEGRYGLPETAATTPYTNCGFHKVICISDLENFLIRHMSNLYVERHGVPLFLFQKQIQTLMDIGHQKHPAAKLFEVETKMPQLIWSKSYYEEADEELLKMVPDNAKNILSIGCGCGVTESRLKERGAKITALPLDSVIGSVIAPQGVEIIYGTWDEAFKALDERKFDCVLMTNLLHLQMNPQCILEKCARFVQENGTLVLSGPNFNRMPWLIKRILGMGHFSKLKDFNRGGVNVCGARTLAKVLKNIGFYIAGMKWIDHEINKGLLSEIQIRFGSLTAKNWILQARR